MYFIFCDILCAASPSHITEDDQWWSKALYLNRSICNNLTRSFADAHMGKQIILTVFAAAIIASFGQLLFSLTPDQRRVVRRYENEAKKLNNAKHAVVFNELCVKENLLPKYSNINLHDRAVQHEDFVIDFRKRLTTEQLSRKKEYLTKLTDDVAKCRADFDQLDLNPESKHKISEWLSGILSDHDEVVRSRVLKKLSHLYKGDICVPKKC